MAFIHGEERSLGPDTRTLEIPQTEVKEEPIQEEDCGPDRERGEDDLGLEIWSNPFRSTLVSSGGRLGFGFLIHRSTWLQRPILRKSDPSPVSVVGSRKLGTDNVAPSEILKLPPWLRDRY